jgi:hypothetical protein
MSRQEQWQVAGNAAEIYEEELVPAIFAPWAPLVVELAYPQGGIVFSMSRVERVSWRIRSPVASPPAVPWQGSISILAC